MAGDDDWTLPELARNIKRLDHLVQGCVTENSYAKAQTEIGKRIEEAGQRITTIESERRTEEKDRLKQRQAMLGMFVAAALGFAGSLALFVLQLVAR